MGAFFLSPKDRLSPDSAPPPGDADVRRRFAGEGFAEPVVRETARWRLYAFPRIAAPETSVFDDADGDFCAVTGTLIYRGRTGAAALPAVLADIKAGRLRQAEAFGQYAILAGVGGTISLQTDPLGIYPVWYNDDRTAISSAFLPVAEATGALNADPQCIYEYVFQGAAYGDRTLFREVHLHPCRRIATFGETVETRDHHPPLAAAVDPAPIEVHLERNLANLGRYYDALASAFGDRIDTALSGGYDSRLTLALLRARGLQPAVHVYGGADDEDVRIARTIAAGEGFAIEHVDKLASAPLDPDAFAASVQANLHAFQGAPPDGIFDNGNDLATRLERCRGGRVALNGGGGEIFRNFFYLPDRSYRVRELLWSFYGAFDPSWCTGAFDERAYLGNMARKVKFVLGTDADRLSRVEVEAVYPLFRCRYWMGLNNSVNNRLGPALTPFIDVNVVPDALSVPLRYKNSGMFEARLIRAVDPALAAYLSDYGHSFADDPHARRRLKDLTVYMRPPRLRRLSFRLKNRRPVEPPWWLTRPYVARAIDPGLPYMREFFRMDRVNSLDQLNRIYTLECLFQHVGPVAAGRS